MQSIVNDLTGWSQKNFWKIFWCVFLFKILMAALLPVGNDEVYYWDWGRDLQLSYFDHPPGVAWLAWLNENLFGWTGTNLRVRGVVLFLYLGVFLVIRKMMNEKESLPLLFTFCFIPAFAWSSLLLLPDAGLIVFLLLGARVLQKITLRKKITWTQSALFGFYLGLGGLFKYHAYFVYILLASSFYFYATFPKRSKFRFLFFSFFFFLLMQTPVLIWNYYHDWSSFKFQFSKAGSGDFSVSYFLRMMVVQSLLVTPLVFLSLFSKRKNCKLKIFQISGFIFLGFFALQSFKGSTLPHWFLAGWWLLLPTLVFKRNRVVWALSAGISLLVTVFILMFSLLGPKGSMLLSHLNGKAGAFAEVYLWRNIFEDEKFLKLKNNFDDIYKKEARPFYCEEVLPFAATRWYHVAHIGFLDRSRKIFSMDPDFRSYYFFRDQFESKGDCPVLLMVQENQFDVGQIRRQLDFVSVDSYTHPFFLDRPMKFIYGRWKKNDLIQQNISATAKSLTFDAKTVRRYDFPMKKYGQKYFDDALVDLNALDFEDRAKINLSRHFKYKTYFGNMHSHTNWSDGRSGDPEEAYWYARNIAKLDFFAVTEHAEFFPFHLRDTYDEIKKISAKYNQDGSYVTFYGFEWTNVRDGHMTLFESDDYCSAWDCQNLKELYDWWSRSLKQKLNQKMFGVFAHPGFLKHSLRKAEFGEFKNIPSTIQPRFLGMEVLHWDGYKPFEAGYSGNLPYIDEALQKNLKIAPMGSQDNHYPNWGASGPNRIGILSDKLTKDHIQDSLLKRKFFATSNDNQQFSVEVEADGNFEMGDKISIMGKEQVHVIVRFLDPDLVKDQVRVKLFVDGKVFLEKDFEKSVFNKAKYSAGEIDITIDSNALKNKKYFYVVLATPDERNPWTMSAPFYL